MKPFNEVLLSSFSMNPSASKSHDRNSKNPKTLYLLSLALIRLGKYDEAFTLYEQALDTIETLRAGVSQKEAKSSLSRINSLSTMN